MGGRPKILFEEAAEKLNTAHKGKITLVEYSIWSKKATFLCVKCNKEFQSLPGNTIRKSSGCPFCAGRDKTTEEFISLAKIVHGDKYDYSETIYLKCKEDVKVFCKKCNKFFTTRASNHISSLARGCKYCAGFSDDEGAAFIEKARVKHKNKFNYDLVDYKNNSTLVIIVCPIHGAVKMRPSDHLTNGGCKLCGVEKRAKKRSLTQEDFISKAKATHGEDYSYKEVVYKNNHTKVFIKCNKCGQVFKQRPQSHLAGRGCSGCAAWGYTPAKCGNFYILVSDNIIKVGICNRPVSVRVLDINKSSGKDFRVIHQIKFSNGAIPQNIERNILSYLRSNYQPVDECYDGSTECFLDVNYDDLLLHVRHEHLKQLKEHYGT